MSQAEREMNEAVEEWLEAYRAHDRYLKATEALFEVFARSWQGSGRYIAGAFTDFREALLRDSGHSPQEVAKVFPSRRLEKESGT